MLTIARISLFTAPAFALLLTGCSSPSSDSSSPTQTSAEQLAAYYWVVQGATDRNGNPVEAFEGDFERPLQLTLNNNQLGIAGSCNLIGGDYRLEGPTLTPGQLVQTMMYCDPEAVMLRETAIKQQLETAQQVQLSSTVPPRLTLTNTHGQRLNLQGEATPETLYGSSGEIMFMEVQAQRVECPHPLMPNHQCLHVREVVYDETGIKQSTGEWQNLYQEIQGYEHRPGIRNVLRLKRFDVANPPADSSSVAYVLDLVVESEVVER